MRFTGETRVDAQGRRQWLVICSECGKADCIYSDWISD
jgi:hypothetical protein